MGLFLIFHPKVTSYVPLALTFYASKMQNLLAQPSLKSMNLFGILNFTKKTMLFAPFVLPGYTPNDRLCIFCAPFVRLLCLLNLRFQRSNPCLCPSGAQGHRGKQKHYVHSRGVLRKGAQKMHNVALAPGLAFCAVTSGQYKTYGKEAQKMHKHNRRSTAVLASTGKIEDEKKKVFY